MRTLSTVAVLLFSGSLFSQTTALDFTANDCDGMPHHLFTDLDEGNAVVIDLVMMGCAPCVTATNGIIDEVLPNVADPSRVKFYSIGFTNSTTCSQMLNWRSTNGWDHPVFAGMSDQTTHYGGMGMPTIVILGGGSAHGVFFNQQGYSSSDNGALIAAINAAMDAAIGVPEVASGTIHLSPNPVTDVIHFGDLRWTQARVVDIQGREILVQPITDGTLDVALIPTGSYVLFLRDQQGNEGSGRFEKQ